MPDNLYERNGTWYGRIQVGGRDVRKSLRTKNRAEASRRLKVLLAAQSAYHGTIRRTFDQVAAEYMLDAASHLKAKTIARYEQSLDVLTDHFGGRWWDAIDKKAVLEFVNLRKKGDVAIRTIKNDLSVLSGAAQFAMEHDWAAVNPVQQIGKRPLRHKPAVFVCPPEADIELALSCVCGPLEQLCRFLRHTGMRRDEATYLRWQDVDMKRRAATLPETKNGKGRTVALDDAAMAILEGRGGQGLVFTRNDGEVYTGVSQGWREAIYKAQMSAQKERRRFQRFRLHDLRHIYAIEYLRDGGNLYALQKQLGHSSIRQTELYLAHLTPDEQDRAKG